MKVIRLHKSALAPIIHGEDLYGIVSTSLQHNSMLPTQHLIKVVLPRHSLHSTIYH